LPVSHGDAPGQAPPLTFTFGRQELFSSSQASIVQGLLSLQSRPETATHAPCTQRSPTLQALPSSQAPPSFVGRCLQPLWGLHESAVQGFLSSQLTGESLLQRPPWQWSPCVQTLLSSQGTPSLTLVSVMHPSIGTHDSTVQGLPSSQLSGPEPMHWPAWHVPEVKQGSSGTHAPPVSGEASQSPVAGLQATALHGVLPLHTTACMRHPPLPSQTPGLHLSPAQLYAWLVQISPEQESTVQGSPSSQLGPTSSQVHWFGALQTCLY
jgi:hypothetical protein